MIFIINHATKFLLSQERERERDLMQSILYSFSRKCIRDTFAAPCISSTEKYYRVQFGQTIFDRRRREQRFLNSRIKSFMKTTPAAMTRDSCANRAHGKAILTYRVWMKRRKSAVMFMKGCTNERTERQKAPHGKYVIMTTM